MNKLKQHFSNFRSSFWFMPTVIVAFSIVLAITLIQVDSAENDIWLAQWPHLFGAGAEGARGMLSTLAGSMMSVMGITFSMTLVALALVANQYTSRILRNFMRSIVTQASLGIFAGIFTYCLIVLRTIRSGDEGTFVPSLAVFFGFVLALGGVGVLIFFIHHIASSIQASSIIASVAQETIAAIDRLFPDKSESESDEDANQLPRSIEERNWHVILAMKSGYIQSLDDDALLHLAQDRNTIARMECGIGDFVVQNTVLASLALESPPDNETIAAINVCYEIGRHRTVEQDPAFGIREIVDVALKALSPGVNDVSTAVICVDYLTMILARLAPRKFPPSHRYVGGELRVIVIAPSFSSLLADSYDQIRRSAAGNVAIMMRMLGALHTIAGLTVSPNRRLALREHVQWIAELADRSIESAHDRSLIEQRLTHVRDALEAESVFCIREKGL